MSVHDTNDDSTDTHPEAQCGHRAPPEETIFVRDVGPLCRRCHTPVHPRNWPHVLDSYNTRNYDGYISHSMYFVGLDEFGRGLYHDTKRSQLITVVPLFHEDFDADLPQGTQYNDLKHDLLRGYSHHGRAGKRLTLDTAQGHYLYPINYVALDEFRHGEEPTILEYVIDTALTDGWQFISDAVIEKLDDVEDRLTATHFSDPPFDHANVKWLLEYGQADFPNY
jgi:hypothetical protein